MAILTTNYLEAHADARNHLLLQIFDEFHLLKSPPSDYALHASRCFEWPWAINKVAELNKGKLNVLDVGTDPHFMAALLSMSQVDSLTCQHIHGDLHHLGTLRPPGTQVLIPIEWYYKAKSDRVRLLVDDPASRTFDDEQYTGKFDVITCISVLEHVPKENVGAWITWLWSSLAPGGRLIFTHDWWIGKGVGWSFQEITNHDLSPWFRWFRYENVEGLGAGDYVPSIHGEKLGLWKEGAPLFQMWVDGEPLGVSYFSIEKA